MLSFGDGNAAGSLETTPKAAKLRHQNTWLIEDDRV